MALSAKTINFNQYFNLVKFVKGTFINWKHIRHHHYLRVGGTAGTDLADWNSNEAIKCSTTAFKTPHRTLFQLPKVPNPMQLLSKQKEFSERKIVGYTIEQMYDVVSQVDHYQEFVPWCKKSFVKTRAIDKVTADLVIGFPPVTEEYTSLVTLAQPHYVRAECKDGKLFNHMVTTWKFGPGLPGNEKTCTLDFHISFEFRSALHSNLATVFFDEMVRTMAKAFLQRAKVCYGNESIKTINLVDSETSW